jgi:hypothetical protein
MVSSGMLRRVALVRTDVSKEPGVSFIRVTRIGELGTTQAATSNRRTLRRNCPPLTINHIKIPVQKEFKYLGLYIYQKLTWQKHIKTKRQHLNLKDSPVY